MKKSVMLFFANFVLIIALCGCSQSGATDYIIPAFVVAWHGPEYTAEDVAEQYKESNQDNDGNYYTAVKANEDGTVTLTMTQEQVETVRRESLDVLISWAKERAANNGGEIMVNDERTAFTYKVMPGLNHSQRVTPLGMVQIACVYEQIFSGIKESDLALDYEIYNAETKELITSGTLPQDSLDDVEVDGETLGLTESYTFGG